MTPKVKKRVNEILTTEKTGEIQKQRCENSSNVNKKLKSHNNICTDFSDSFINLETEHWKELKQINYGPKVYYIYNPLEYAKQLHDDYIKKYCKAEKEVILLGMNPGPWGMCQTGVPFGEVNFVKNWLQIEGNILKPDQEHELRPITGLNCDRKEVSGDRMWSLLKELSGEPKVLFRHIFVHNYCPLAFLAETGKNITPVDFKVKERKPLEAICDTYLLRAVELLNTKHLVCIGNYVKQRAEKAFAQADITHVKISLMMHPSPANPAANKGWRAIAINQLKEAGILTLFNCS
ncbi:UNVERIFIED_CONTAM: hypothetical protein GTU68_022443 [Idotea baltica]|nr:hypothetical protein [Idotea baltica]